MWFFYCFGCSVSYFWYVARKALRLVASNSETSLDHSTNKATDTIDVAYLVLRLLPSKDGVAIRRLLMTAVSSYKLSILLLSCTQRFCHHSYLICLYWLFVMFECPSIHSNRYMVSIFAICGCKWWIADYQILL